MISSLLFERPFALAGACVGIEFLWIWIGSRERSPATARAVWIWPVVSVALVAMSIAVVTPHERITEVCRELGRAVDEGEMAAIASAMASDFSAEGLDRDELLRRIEPALTRVRVDEVRLRNFEVDLADDRHATAIFDASCNVRSTEGFAGALPSRWRLSFRREGENWLLTRIESIPVLPLRIGRLEGWLRK